MTYLLIIIALASSPIPSQVPHTLFDIISLGVDAVSCHDEDTYVLNQWMYDEHGIEYFNETSGKLYSDNNELQDELIFMQAKHFIGERNKLL